MVAVALLAMAAGFGQFGAVASLGSVAKTFGHLTHGATFSDEVGLSGTVLGVGLAVMPAGLARRAAAGRSGRPLRPATDAARHLRRRPGAHHRGRRWPPATGGSWSSSPWAGPFLSATLGLAQVAAVELTASADRARAVAMVAAGYAVGAGLTAVVHSLAGGTLGFRGIFALAVVPLVMLPLLARRVVEPSRFTHVSAAEHRPPVLGPVGPAFRGPVGGGGPPGPGGLGHHRAGQQPGLHLRAERPPPLGHRHLGHGGGGRGGRPGGAPGGPVAGRPLGPPADGGGGHGGHRRLRDPRLHRVGVGAARAATCSG